MMKVFQIASVLFQLSVSFVYAAAVPAANDSYPEVKPGPGLPTLSSLGLTSAQLYQEKPAALSAGLHSFAPDFQAFCGGGENDAARVDDVIACFNYLEHLGHTNCVVPRGGVQFCEAGTASIEGVIYDTSASTVSSYCADVALGVQWVFTYCNKGGLVEGDQAANGNGNLVVVVGGICGSPVAPCN